jgi:tetratricopeptide (TPR) repeat protein
MLINPEGPRVLLAPFLRPSGIYAYTRELESVDFSPLLNLTHGLRADNVVLILLLFGLVSLLLASRDLKRHVFPVLLAVGGLILLSRGIRFVWEWLLLTTPLFTVGLQLSVDPQKPLTWKSVLALTAMLMLVASPWWFQSNSKQYPFNENTLPQGTTDFIQNLGINGKYAVPPSLAGYIEWRLIPKIQIYSDMQTPPFHELDFFEVTLANINKSANRHFIKKYQPDLIGVRVEHSVFPTLLARDSPYVPVFFDQLLVLYIDSRKHPGIAAEYRIKHIDPFQPDLLKSSAIEPAIAELKQMLQVTTNIPSVALTLLGYLIETGQIEAAKPYASALLERQFESERLHYFVARMAQSEEDYPVAIHHYKTSIGLSANPNRAKQHLAECYFHTEEHQKTVDLFDESLNLYKEPSPNLLHYYLFAFSSYIVGDDTQAKRLLDMFLILDDGANPGLSQQVLELQRILEVTWITLAPSDSAMLMESSVDPLSAITISPLMPELSRNLLALLIQVATVIASLRQGMIMDSSMLQVMS